MKHHVVLKHFQYIVFNIEGLSTVLTYNQKSIVNFWAE